MFGLLSLTHIVMLQIYNLCLYTTRFYTTGPWMANC